MAMIRTTVNEKVLTADICQAVGGCDKCRGIMDVSELLPGRSNAPVFCICPCHLKNNHGN